LKRYESRKAETESPAFSLRALKAKANRLGDGEDIRSLREKLGELTPGLYDRYEEYCASDGSNEVGGKKLPAQFLAKINHHGKG
jgi:hypothetical protein